ncbi:glycosyltransferase family 2 protein [Arenicella xantha]|uniref:GT2 family glycosyltransferase n=1 Tax=Arenicella xantha TaxID=644221 RepID=A0A395JHM5_9GAMM|nr:galactosyltransferase-related protein [Arenicella xantha]RBP49173.1 GT2 family glycosyltransferase [Arenicella xantha]
MTTSVRQKLGALFWDVPIYICSFARQLLFGTPAWIEIRDRHQKLIRHDQSSGVACEGQWTSDLYLPSVFPRFGALLYKFAMRSHRIDLAPATQPHSGQPEVSFIIGHRGMERLPLLLKTLDSVSAQTGCACECIVVEQDSVPRIKNHLPKWVRYVHIIPTDDSTPYSRSWGFNVGATHARAEALIFHDNDMLVPRCYAYEILSRLQQGYDFINLKRFVFYFDQISTNAILAQEDVLPTLGFDSIMQNLEGGGSVGASKRGFNNIGGFDERFLGWGGEDNEFWERAQTQRVWPYTYLPILHLWHAPQPEKQDTDPTLTKHLHHELSKQPALERVKKLKQANAKYDDR